MQSAWSISFQIISKCALTGGSLCSINCISYFFLDLQAFVYAIAIACCCFAFLSEICSFTAMVCIAFFLLLVGLSCINVLIFSDIVSSDDHLFNGMCVR